MGGESLFSGTFREEQFQIIYSAKMRKCIKWTEAEHGLGPRFIVTRDGFHYSTCIRSVFTGTLEGFQQAYAFGIG